MKKYLVFGGFAVLVLSIVLSACGRIPVRSETGSSGNSDGSQLPAAVVKAREALAAKISISLGEIAVASFTQATWQDSCLGLGGIAESCLQAQVEGWLVELSAKGETYMAHTDLSGDQVRFEP